MTNVGSYEIYFIYFYSFLFIFSKFYFSIKKILDSTFSPFNISRLCFDGYIEL